jgi:hypothetical protein
MFATAIHFHPILICAGKARVESLTEPHSNGTPCQRMQVANTLAYGMAIITTVKSFIVQAPGVCTITILTVLS